MSNGRWRWTIEMVRRVVLILATAAVVIGVTAVFVGWPSSRLAVGEARVYGPTMPFGLIQFGSQAALFAVGVIVARRWLRVRL